MINYTLKCHDCRQECEAWFKNSDDFDKQKDNGLLECPICNSKNVDKGLMAPSIVSSNDTIYDRRAILRKLRQYVEGNFENVGERFADEAIAIAHGEADERDIYGEIDKKAEEKLAKEGILYAKIPWTPKEDA